MRLIFALFFFFGQSVGDLCPPDWYFSNSTSNCYLLSSASYSFDDAETFCEYNGGFLSSIRIYSEATELANYTSASVLAPWIGAKTDPFGNWYNVDGTSFYSYLWSKNEPSLLDGCAALRSSDNGLFSIPCYSVQPALCKQPASACNGGSFGGYRINSGTFTSPNYPNHYYNNLDCSYYIQAPNNTYITINFDPYFVESYFDYVTVYDGFSFSTGNIIGKITYSTDKTTFESTSNQMTVLFHTDTSGVRAGWQASWNAKYSVNPIYQNGTSGELTSPNYPNNYSPYTEQTYFVSTYPGFKINATIDSFYTEINYDYLLVYSNSSLDDSALVTSLNGSAVVPWSYITPLNELALVFKSDGSLEHSGWHLIWNIVEP